MRKVRSLLKAWGFRFFAWRIDVKLSKLPDKDRILYLGNILFDECERQGLNTKSSANDMRILRIDYFPTSDPKYGNMGIQSNYGRDDWKVSGNRTGTTPKEVTA